MTSRGKTTSQAPVEAAAAAAKSNAGDVLWEGEGEKRARRSKKTQKRETRPTLRRVVTCRPVYASRRPCSRDPRGRSTWRRTLRTSAGHSARVRSSPPEAPAMADTATGCWREKEGAEACRRVAVWE